jgi:hypothetical protein
MSYLYANLTLQGVSQDELVEHLSSLGSQSCVSPMVNNFTVMYDKSFYISLPKIEDTLREIDYIFQYTISWVEPSMRDAYKDYLKSLNLSSIFQQQRSLDLTKLSPKSREILEQYQGVPEGNLVCWASYLSSHFSCAVIACCLRDESQFWCHLSQNGAMLDEYTTYADDTEWKPGEPILTENGSLVKGGNAMSICSVFDRVDRTDEVEIIFRKPANSSAVIDNNIDYDSLLKLGEFSNDRMRHRALAIALGISTDWAMLMDCQLTDSEGIKDYPDEDKSHNLPKEIWISELQCTQLNDSAEEENPGKLAEAYADNLIKDKKIAIHFPESILPDFQLMVQNLTLLEISGAPSTSSLLFHLVESILQDRAFSKPGKFDIILYLMSIVESLTEPQNLEARKIALSAMFNLNSMFHNKFLTPCGRLWLQYAPLLKAALNSDR